MATQNSTAGQRPNVVLIVWHDLGDWLGCYGHMAVESPCLDQFAEQGMLFERFFSTGAVCSPGRASLVTGLMPHETGVNGLVGRGFDMRRDVRTLPQVFRAAGYSTHLFGLQHECTDPVWEGYDDIRSEQRSAAYVADQAEQFFAERGGARSPASPFYLALGTFDVHRPHGDQYDPHLLRRVEHIGLPPYLPDADVARRDMAIFFTRIQEADRHMGRIFDALERSGMAEDTIVIFTSDHGADIPRAKVTLYDPGTKVACMVRWPGVVPASQRRACLLSNVDVLPTLCELAGITAVTGSHGRSFAPLLRGTVSAGTSTWSTTTPELDGGTGHQPPRRTHTQDVDATIWQPREAVFTEFSWSTMYRPMRAVRTQQFKLIRNFEPGLPPHIVGGAIVRYGVALIEQVYAQPVPEFELFDVQADPFELDNRASDPEYSEVRRHLEHQLADWLTRTGDPLLNGPVPNPNLTNTFVPIWRRSNGRFRLNPASVWSQAKP